MSPRSVRGRPWGPGSWPLAASRGLRAAAAAAGAAVTFRGPGDPSASAAANLFRAAARRPRPAKGRLTCALEGRGPGATSAAWSRQTPSARGRGEPPRPRRRLPQPGTRAVTWARARLLASRARSRTRAPRALPRFLAPTGRAAQAHRQVGGAGSSVGGSPCGGRGPRGRGRLCARALSPALPGSRVQAVKGLGGSPEAKAVCDL